MEARVQRTLRKTAQEHKRLYPTGSSPRKLYHLAKLHRLLENQIIYDLLIRSIVFDATTYHLAKYVSKSLSTLRLSHYDKK